MIFDERWSLTAQECSALIPPSGIGRAAVVVGALPAIVASRYQWGPERLVLSLPPDERAAAALGKGGVICFSVDAFDHEGHGWIVNVVGHATIADSGDILVPYDVITGRHFKFL